MNIIKSRTILDVTIKDLTEQGDDTYHIIDPMKFKTIYKYELDHYRNYYTMKIYTHSHYQNGEIGDSLDFFVGEWVNRIISRLNFDDPDHCQYTDCISSDGFETYDGMNVWTYDSDIENGHGILYKPYEGGPIVDGKTILDVKDLPELKVTPYVQPEPIRNPRRVKRPIVFN